MASQFVDQILTTFQLIKLVKLIKLVSILNIAKKKFCSILLFIIHLYYNRLEITICSYAPDTLYYSFLLHVHFFFIYNNVYNNYLLIYYYYYYLLSLNNN